MRVRRVGFVGTRTANVQGMAAFLRDVLGLEVRRSDPDWSIAQLPTGRFDFVEIYGPSMIDERLAPRDVSVFVAFVVDDLEGAHEEVKAAGVEVGELIWAQEAFDNPAYAGLGWFFLRAPDGNVYVIQQTPDWANEQFAAPACANVP